MARTSIRKVASTKTREERREQAEALQASIADQVETLRASQAWKRFLHFSTAFHNYSINNVFLILAQNPQATRVTGFRTWQKLGRQVRKGERSLKIFGFRQSVRKHPETDDVEGDQQSTSRDEKGAQLVTFYPLVSVFDISQTDLIDPEAGDPGKLVTPLSGEDEHGIYAAVSDYLTDLGWTVSREKIHGTANGYTTTDGSRRVVVDVVLSHAQAAKTLLHEAAHVLLHVSGDPAADRAAYAAHRGIAETEAESVAYTVAGVLGLDTSAYTIGYVADWAEGDPAVIKSTAARVLGAVHTLLDALAAPVGARTAVADEEATADLADDAAQRQLMAA